MKNNNIFFEIKGSVGKSSLLNYLQHSYEEDGTHCLSICYDKNFPIQGVTYIINSQTMSAQELMSFISEAEENIINYNGKIFIYTNKTFAEVQELINFIKNYNFQWYINKDGDDIYCREIFFFYKDETELN